MRFTRITVDPAQMGGVPCVRGMRIPVATVPDMLADGMADAEVVTVYRTSRIVKYWSGT